MICGARQSRFIEKLRDGIFARTSNPRNGADRRALAKQVKDFEHAFSGAAGSYPESKLLCLSGQALLVSFTFTRRVCVLPR